MPIANPIRLVVRCTIEWGLFSYKKHLLITHYAQSYKIEIECTVQ